MSFKRKSIYNNSSKSSPALKKLEDEENNYNLKMANTSYSLATATNQPPPPPSIPASPTPSIMSTNTTRKDSSNRSNDRFHELFPSVPIYETVLQSYACAYMKSINLLHGIMFLTSNYICFYSKILAHETILVVKWQHVTMVAKTNYALLFPTAIRIDTTKSSYSFTTFRSRGQTYDYMHEIWANAKKKQQEISNAKPDDVLNYSLKLSTEHQLLQQCVHDSNTDGTIGNTNETLVDQQQKTSASYGVGDEDQVDKAPITKKNSYYCRSTYDNNRNYYVYDLNFSNLTDKNMVTVSLRHKKTLIQRTKMLMGLLIPGFFNRISRIDSLLPICFLMCILLLLNAFVLLNKVNQVDNLFKKLLEPL